MNKAEFITLIENPQNLDKSHITALKNITADFPYFQASHILLSKALFNENHYEFEKQLRSTALLVSDRELLYRFLHNLHIDEPIEEQNFVRAQEQEIIEITEIIPPKTGEPTTETKIEAVIEEESNEIAASVVETVQTIVEHSDPEILHHKSEAHSFAEWLALGSEKIKEEIVEHKLVEDENGAEQDIKTAQIISVEKPDVSSNIHEFDSILDKFIKENPSISRPKAEFYNPAVMASQSNEEDDDLITETLANIYRKQGAYKKAIRAYEKLCLIYPHKMTYFADLIQKIKEENKND